jgi:hypothetical protein
VDFFQKLLAKGPDAELSAPLVEVDQGFVHIQHELVLVLRRGRLLDDVILSRFFWLWVHNARLRRFLKKDGVIGLFTLNYFRRALWRLPYNLHSRLGLLYFSLEMWCLLGSLFLVRGRRRNLLILVCKGEC